MDGFDTVLKRAAEHHGGVDAVEQRLDPVKSARDLSRTGDDRILSQMTECVFQAGFSWKVIESKWDGFETVFQQFDPQKMAFLNDEELEAIGRDARVVRNMQKIITVPRNARFVLDIAETHGSFAKFIADWPLSDQVGLWEVFKKQGSRLGGATAQYFLRFVGKDSVVLSQDVVRCLKTCGALDTDKPTSKKALTQAQAAFNQWHEETGRPYTHLSRIAAMSVGPH